MGKVVPGLYTIRSRLMRSHQSRPSFPIRERFFVSGGRRKTNHETSNRLNSVSRLNKIFARRCTNGGAIELPRPIRPISCFFLLLWKRDGRANNNGEKSWTRSRAIKIQAIKIRLERWDKSKKERKKEEGKRNVAKFPINNKFINERLDIPSRWPINLRIFVFFFTENNSGLID